MEMRIARIPERARAYLHQLTSIRQHLQALSRSAKVAQEQLKNLSVSAEERRRHLQRIDSALEDLHAVAQRQSQLELSIDAILALQRRQRDVMEQLRFANASGTLSEIYELITSKQLGMLESLDHIARDRMSLARFGDGELGMLVNPVRDIAFQRNSPQLSRDLHRILAEPVDGLMIGMPQMIYDHGWMLIYARFWPAIRHIVPSDPQLRWANAHVTRPLGFERHRDTLVQGWRRCWNDRDVTLVTGAGSRFEILPAFFDNVRSMEDLHSLPRDAYDDLPRVIDRLTGKRRDLVLISLGPAGTVLAARLHTLGIQALDIGHLTSSYRSALLGDPAPEQSPMVKA